MTLISNKDYFGKKPYLNEFQIYFLTEKRDENKEPSGIAKKELLNLLQKGSIDGAIIDSNSSYDKNSFTHTTEYNIKNPEYFALFLNTQTKLFSNKNIRKAVDLAINKETIISKAVKGQGYVVNSPTLSEFYQNKETEHLQDIDKAISLLEEEGFQEKDGIRVKTLKKLGDLN